MSKAEIVAQLAAGTLTADVALTMLNALEVKAVGDEFRQIKLSEKGAINLGRIPGANAQFGCVMYASALEYILKHQDKIKQFISDNAGKVSRKAAA